MTSATHPANIQAASATIGSAATSATLWGLHLSDLGVIISSLAAVCGVVIQLMLYLNTRKETTRGQSQADRSDEP